MFCKNCGNKLNGNETVCPSCNSAIENSSENVSAAPGISDTKNTGTNDHLSSFMHVAKKKLGIKSIFDDSIPRTALQRSASTKYLILTFCTILLIFFWSANTMKLSIPIDGDFVIEFSTSFKALFSGLSDIKEMIVSNEDGLSSILGSSDLETLDTIMLIISIIIIVHTIATLCLYATPIFAFFPLMQRSVEKRIWITLEKACLIISCVVHFTYFIALKLGVLFLKSTLNDAVSDSISFSYNLKFNSIFFILAYVVAFVCIASISKSLWRFNGKSRVSAVEEENV